MPSGAVQGVGDRFGRTIIVGLQAALGVLSFEFGPR